MKNEKDVRHILTVLVFAFFTFMMVYNLTNSSLWGDELTELVYSQASIRKGELYERICSTFQPPLYNFVMHFWLMLSTGVLWFRLFNVFLGVGMALFLYASLCKTVGRTGALFTMAVLGSCYQWVYCIQECSEYALMLFFLFGSFYFFTKGAPAEMTLLDEAGFILMNVGAMYSQYGAIFCVLPLLVVYFLRRLQAKDMARLKRTLLLYTGAFVLFAVPLYWFFLRFQTESIDGSERDVAAGMVSAVKDLPFVMGGLIKYFFHLKKSVLPELFFTLAGLLILCTVLFAAFCPNVKGKAKELAVILLMAYTLFVVLVDLRVYAMVHPNQSAGFYSRYAYFFLPLLSVGLPAVLSGAVRALFPDKRSIRMLALAGGCMAVMAATGLPGTLQNWHKAYDDIFMRIWVSNAGFADDSYILGMARNGFNYYIGSYACEITGNIMYAVDCDALGDRFWVWRTNWGGDEWRTLVDYAAEHGYKVEVFADHGYEGQLARCTKTDA